MADPVVHITGGVPDSGTGNITTLGQTLLDGANLTLGAMADAAIVAGTTGSISAKLRAISRDLVGGVVLQTGANTIGAVTQSGTWTVGGAVTVSGTVAATQSGAWTVSISGTATVSGTVTANQGGAPWAENQTQLNGVALGSPSAYGTSPGAINVQGVNAFVTNSVAVTGTFWQATQPVSGTITANQGGAWTVAATQSGTWTQRLQDGSGNAIGSTSGSLNVNITGGAGSGGTSSSFGTAFPATGTAAGAEYLSSPPTLTTGQMVALQTDVNGNLKTSLIGTATVSGTVTANQGGAPWTIKPDGTVWALTGTSANVNLTNASVAVTGTFWQATQPISVASLPLPSGAATSANQATAAAIGSTTSGQTGHLAFGAVTTAAPSYTTAQSNALSLTTAGALRVDSSAVTQPVSGTFWQATQPVSIAAAVTVAQATAANLNATVTGTVTANQGGTWTVQPGNTQNTTPWLTRQSQTAANNGLTASRVVAAATTNATSLKASAGNIAAIDLFNVAAYMVFLKLYNKASAPTVGTDTPVWTIPIPASGGFSIVFNEGEYFSTGIAFAITKLQADTDTTAIAAGDVTGRIKWV